MSERFDRGHHPRRRRPRGRQSTSSVGIVHNPPPGALEARLEPTDAIAQDLRRRCATRRRRQASVSGRQWRGLHGRRSPRRSNAQQCLARLIGGGICRSSSALRRRRLRLLAHPACALGPATRSRRVDALGAARGLHHRHPHHRRHRRSRCWARPSTSSPTSTR